MTDDTNAWIKDFLNTQGLQSQVNESSGDKLGHGQLQSPKTLLKESDKHKRNQY